MGLEGVDPAACGLKLPPVLLGGRPGGEEKPADTPADAPPPLDRSCGSRARARRRRRRRSRPRC